MTYGYKSIHTSLVDSITYYRETGIHKGKLTDITKLRHETKNYKGKNVDVYYTDGKDYTFLTHSIAKQQSESVTGINKALNNKLIKDPSLWQKKDLNDNGFLSLTTTFKKNGNSKTSYNSDGSVILGFNEIPTDQILLYANNDGGLYMSGMPGIYQKYDYFYEKSKEFFDTVQDYIDGYDPKNSKFNEVGVTRYLPNGEKRLPDFIVVNNNQNAKDALNWASYYNIPIVVLRNTL